MDPHLSHTNLNAIPKECTELYVTGSFLKQQMYQGKMCIVGDTQLSPYSLNERIKQLKHLSILDLSGCIDITKIWNGFSHIGVETIILPPNVYELPNISYCPNLTTLIGKGLTIINHIVGCPALEKIEFNENLNNIKIPNTNIRVLNIPNVEVVDFGAFENCANLESIVFSSKLKIIGSGAFKNCTSLYKVDIPEHCQIEAEAFLGCSSLKYVSLPNDLETLQKNVFANCHSLQYISGGKNIDTIKAGAFLNCCRLSLLNFLPKEVDENAFDYIIDNHIGIVLTSNKNSIIWCFDTKSFFLCENDLDYSLRDKLVLFSSNHRFTFATERTGVKVECNPCQTAINLQFEFDVEELANFSKLNISKSIQYFTIEKAVKAYIALPKEFPDIIQLREDIYHSIQLLDLKEIISAYHTEVSESQTWKVGGDNTYHSYKKTSVLYTDPYIEKILPVYDEEYHESACYDFSNEIDLSIQVKQNELEASLKKNSLTIIIKRII